MATVYAKLVVEVEGDNAATTDLKRFDSTEPGFERDLDAMLFSLVNTWKLHGVEPQTAFEISRTMYNQVAVYIEKMEANNGES
jgi:hypothetical protein